MSVSIPEEILEQAGDCSFGQRCRHRSKGHPKCRVVEADGEKVLYLKQAREGSCVYLTKFGHAHICRCPVHFYLYNHKGNDSSITFRLAGHGINKSMGELNIGKRVPSYRRVTLFVVLLSIDSKADDASPITFLI